MTALAAAGHPFDRPSFLPYMVVWNAGRRQSLPAHHARIAVWLDRMWHRERRLLLMAFRGAGKSTLIGLFCAWLLTRRPDLRILTLSADEALARRMLRSARKAIEQHPESEKVRPERPDQWSALRFSVAGAPHGRDPSMQAAGLDSNITGARADVVICDDVEVPKTCATRALREKLRERLGELNFVLTPGGTQIFAGTPHAWDSIYGTARADAPDTADAGPDRPAAPLHVAAAGGGFLEGYVRYELPVMDEAGAPAWPERYGAAHIELLRRRAGPVRFASQMMLQPADAEQTRLDIGLIHPYEARLVAHTANGEQILFLDGRRLRSASCWWDPAYGGEERRDASAIACVFTDTEGHHFIHDVQYLRNDAAFAGEHEADAQCRQAAEFARRNLVTSVTVEANGIGGFLPGMLRGRLHRMLHGKTRGDLDGELRGELRGEFLGELRGMQVSVIARHNSGQKAARILKAFDARLAAGVLHAHRQVLAGPFGDEMQTWRPVEGHGKGRDDALDAVAGCLEAEPTIIRKTAPPPSRRPSWHAGGATHRVTME